MAWNLHLTEVSVAVGRSESHKSHVLQVTGPSLAYIVLGGFVVIVSLSIRTRRLPNRPPLPVREAPPVKTATHSFAGVVGGPLAQFSQRRLMPHSFPVQHDLTYRQGEGEVEPHPS